LKTFELRDFKIIAGSQDGNSIQVYFLEEGVPENKVAIGKNSVDLVFEVFKEITGLKSWFLGNYCLGPNEVSVFIPDKKNNKPLDFVFESNDEEDPLLDFF